MTQRKIGGTAPDMTAYDIEWTTQSVRSADSMPFGGHDVGCNAWAENGSLYLYVGHSASFDENGTLLKLCRLKLTVDDGSVFDRHFRQHLHLKDGRISIEAGDPGNRVRFELWAAVDKSEVHLAFSSDRKHRVEAAFETWRHRDREVGLEETHQCRDLNDLNHAYRDPVITRADQVESEDGLLLFWHRNCDDDLVWDKLIRQQHLEPIADRIPNPLKGRTSGGLLRMDGFKRESVRDGAYAGCDHRTHPFAADSIDHAELVLTIHVAQCGSIAQWKEELRRKAQSPATAESARCWWNEYFDRSWICIDMDHPESEWFRIGRNYQLFRHMLGCNRNGEYPTKFNGGMFTFDEKWTPDFRQWSGIGFTSQNQRLVYWGMLKSGDFEEMRPQLDYWKNITEAGKARVRHFWKHDGAFFFEQGNLFGICTGCEYNWGRDESVDPALEDNPWVRLHWSSGLEFALMMLEHARYAGTSIADCMDFIESVIILYFERYPLGEDGKLRIFPSTSLETWKGAEPRSRDDARYGCLDPMDAVVGLRCLLEALLDHPEPMADPGKWKRLLDLCPELPKGRDAKGRTIFLPAREYAPKPFNCELPELYPVFPFSPRGLSPEEREIARNTWEQTFPPDMYQGFSWHQNGIFATRLGLYEDALHYLRIKLEDSPKRYPAFWGPGHDWTPDHNHGGSGMIQLQEMILQLDGDEPVLLPTWDRSVDVSFRLHAPHGRVVEGELKNGLLHVNDQA